MDLHEYLLNFQLFLLLQSNFRAAPERAGKRRPQLMIYFSLGRWHVVYEVKFENIGHVLSSFHELGDTRRVHM